MIVGNDDVGEAVDAFQMLVDVREAVSNECFALPLFEEPLHRFRHGRIVFDDQDGNAAQAGKLG